jgi:hypothetical protein
LRAKDAVQTVAQATGQCADGVRDAPWSAETGDHAANRIGVAMRAGFVDQQERGGIVGVQPMRRQQRAAVRPLHRREAVAPGAIVPQQEIHPAVAQHAGAVEHDDGAGLTHGRASLRSE